MLPYCMRTAGTAQCSNKVCGVCRPMRQAGAHAMGVTIDKAACVCEFAWTRAIKAGTACHPHHYNQTITANALAPHTTPPHAAEVSLDRVCLQEASHRAAKLANSNEYENIRNHCTVFRMHAQQTAL